MSTTFKDWKPNPHECNAPPGLSGIQAEYSNSAESKKRVHVALNWKSGVKNECRLQRPLSDAIVSAMQYCRLRTLLHMQSCPGLCKNRPVNMYTTGQCATVHVCARVSEHPCTKCSMNYSRFFYDAANTNGRTILCHHDMRVKNGERVPSTKGV